MEAHRLRMLGIVAAALLVAGAAGAQEDGPRVLRGGTAEAAADGPVSMLRGRGPEPRPAEEVAPREAVLLAGHRLWLVEPEAGRLVGCRLEDGVMVGKLSVRCAERRDPGLF